jgi:16S rRNA (guanine966-N2)-methyltransferase
VRETLFNWLREDIEGSRCLDLYSGSGALGFEAASRGACRVVQVESDVQVCAAIRQNCELLSASQVQVKQENVRHFLAGPSESFEIVFLDPPFRRGWLLPSCEMLERRGWLAEHALIYLEAERELKLDGLPVAWQRIRHGEAGDVAYALYKRNPQTTS